MLVSHLPVAYFGQYPPMRTGWPELAILSKTRFCYGHDR